MYRKHSSFFLIITSIAVAFFVFMCGCQKSGYKIPNPDVSSIQPNIHLVRFEKELMKADSTNYNATIESLKNTYPDFFDLFVNKFLGYTSQAADSVVFNQNDTLYNYMVNNTWMKMLYDSVENIYSDMSDVEKDINNAFKYYSYYFPDSTLPHIYTFIAPFVSWTIIDVNTIGIELDMFMGKHFGYYGSYERNFPHYLTIRSDKPYITAAVMKSMIDGNIPDNGRESTLLDKMIQEGKIMYYLDLMMPQTPDSIKIGFTGKQIDWCTYNEDDVWKFFAGEELLFSKKAADISKYLDEAPSTYGMPSDSPGRTAIWVGWQIVRTYMKKNPKTTLPQLFSDTDGLSILKKSDYDPKGK